MKKKHSMPTTVRNYIYYALRPLIPRFMQIKMRRILVHKQRILYANIWPINELANNSRNDWRGWPQGKKFALVLTHDVEKAAGQEKVKYLYQLEEDLGFRSSFNFVPLRYKVSSELRRILLEKGFEVGVHGLYHDGKLYKSYNEFKKRALLINHYLKDWKAVGFRSPAMHHNLEWIHELNIEYDSSTFDTDPFEPQSDGVTTIFPFLIQNKKSQNSYVELPYTLAQDSTLFILMQEKTIDMWKRKLDWIAEHGGMALLNTHPDYMNFSNSNLRLEEFPANLYAEFLEYVKTQYKDQYWHGLAKDVARNYRKSQELQI